jgi:preprotein translocase subunit YajC
MLISVAYAQDASPLGGDGGLVSLLPLVLIFVVFYFLLIRPQQKKVKAHRAMVEALRRGDRVVTGGGILGLVTKVVNESEAQIEIADNVRIKVLRGTIQEVLSKPEPAGKSKGSQAQPANDPGGVSKAKGLLGGLLGGGKSNK